MMNPAKKNNPPSGPVSAVLAKVSGVRSSGAGWVAVCPAHDDKSPSLSIGQGDDGRALLKCFVGCTTESVAKALGMSLRDLMPECRDPVVVFKKKTTKQYATPELAIAAAVAQVQREHGKCPSSTVWDYHDAGGNLVGRVVRLDLPDGGKTFRPVHRAADGWCVGAMPNPRPLYRLPDIAGADVVAVCEGEKAADAARSLGFAATTSVGGSQAPKSTDWRPLVGKEVWLFPDNDLPGLTYAKTVRDILGKLDPAIQIRVIDLPGLPEKGDIADFVAGREGMSREDIRREVEAIATATPVDKTPPPVDETSTFEQENEVSSTVDTVDRYKSFPVDDLPEPIRSFVIDGSAAIGCDASFIALPLLTSLAAAVGNTRQLMIKRGWYVPCVLWSAVIGESGSMKTPAFRLVMKPVRDRQDDATAAYAQAMDDYARDLAVWEKEFSAWKKANSNGDPPSRPTEPHYVRYVVSDATVEALAPILRVNPRGLLMARDELSGWIGSFDRYAAKGKSGADSSNWLSMYSAETVVVDRKTGVPRTIHIPHAAVSVTGGIQPGILKRAFGPEHRESGLAARLLMAWPPRRQKSWTEADISPSAESDLKAIFAKLFDLDQFEIDGKSRPATVRLSPAAKEVWVEYYQAHAQEHVDLCGDLSAAWSKLEEAAARLALVVHFVRWASGCVRDEFELDHESMSSGVALATWFKQEARRVYGMLDESEPDSIDRQLVEWIARKGGTVTVRDVQRGFRQLKEPGEAEKALTRLKASGLGDWQNSPPGAKGGRPSIAFSLKNMSTLSTVDETPVLRSKFEVSSTKEGETGPLEGGSVDSADQFETWAIAHEDDPGGDDTFDPSLFSNNDQCPPD